MTNILTQEENDFLIKIEQQKQKHNASQLKYRLKNEDKLKDYNKQYHEQKQQKINDLKAKFLKEPIKIDVKSIAEKPIIKKNKRGAKKQIEALDIVPSYKTRKEVLELSTIEDYLKKANIIHKLFKKTSITQSLNNELKKLLNDNEFIDENLILKEMDYINDDIIKTIETLRSHYINDNSFKNYLNILSVITSHLKTINTQIYQQLTKTGIYINKSIQDKREDNILEEKDEGKIIDLEKETVLKTIEKIADIEDRLIYGIYTLIPSRRLEWRMTKITTESNTENLKDGNYIIISKVYKAVFNEYKTAKTYKQQIIDIPKELKDIIDRYISIKQLKDGDNLFGLSRDNRELYSEANFSKKLSNIFKKIYNKDITLRFIRMSWSVHIDKMKVNKKQKKALIISMGHSIQESHRYFKDV